jgi:hypothetical protein
MTQFQWNSVVFFTGTLAYATLTKDEIIRDGGLALCRQMIKNHPYIPKALYNDINGVLSPSGKAIAYTQAMRKAPGNVIIPQKEFNDNGAFADFILASRKTTDDRWEVFGEIARMLRKHKDWPDYSEAFFNGLCEVGGTFIATGETSAYKKAVNHKEEQVNTVEDEKDQIPDIVEELDVSDETVETPVEEIPITLTEEE